MSSPWAPFSQATKKEKPLVEGYILLSEGSDKGTPMLLGEDATPIKLGEQNE